MKRIFRTKFNATHYIKGHPRCGQKHSHQYELEVEIESGLVFLDFHEIREKVEKAMVVSGIVDHKENDLGNMTAEKLSKILYDNIREEMKNLAVKNLVIKLYETEHFGVEFP